MIEAITIYLAAGAPFGVSHFLRGHGEAARPAALLRAAWAALLWPVAAATTLLLARRRGSADDGAAANDGDAFGAKDEAKIERARRQLLATLFRVEELARALPGVERGRSELIARAVLESAESYTGLTLGAARVNADDRPGKREMELCRIAGRKGDDLLLAGRCIHRRNVARLEAHRARARTTLLHALAEVRELVGEASAHGTDGIAAARHRSVAILRFYGCAVNLLSLLEDEGAALAVARLLDAECARLRRLEAVGPNIWAEHSAGGGEECTPHARRLAFTGPSQTSPLTRG
ncbi:MAG TPA: hypothetical protein VGX92_09330 [Pyrinomonadaceae bacterium]|jgi:hypothetical protein|nr:hypothetical protein [Pyrinomonadaceae bacterium]